MIPDQTTASGVSSHPAGGRCGQSQDSRHRGLPMPSSDSPAPYGVGVRLGGFSFEPAVAIRIKDAAQGS